MKINLQNDYRFEGTFVNDPKFTTYPTTRNGITKENSVVRFTLAVPGGKDGESKEVTFIPCEAWDSGATLLSKFQKGDKIACIGIMRNNKWLDKETQEERRELVCRISRFYVVDNNCNMQEDNNVK